MAKIPPSLRVGTSGGAGYIHRPGFFAVRRSSKGGARGALAVMAEDASHAFAVFEGAPEEGGDAEVGPVYSAGPAGPWAVPTGRLLVRFQQGARVEDHLQDLERAGFVVEKTLSYAPNAAWVRPREGGVGRALAGLGKLERLPQVVHVEPQLLLERAEKG